MRDNALRTLIDRGETAVNAWLSGDGSFLAEVFSYAGYDTVTIDAQHGMFGRDTILRLLQAVSNGPATPIVRLAALDPGEIGWVLDAGAQVVICPMINSADQAAALVQACRYPPRGERSFGPARSLLDSPPNYLENADREVMVWAMIETHAAVENMAAIIATPGLDGVFVGPNDLALALDLAPGGLISPTVAAVLDRVSALAHDRGLAAGLFCANAVEAKEWADRGFDLVTPGSDAALVKAGAVAALATIKP